MHIFTNPNFDFVRWKWHAIMLLGYTADDSHLRRGVKAAETVGG